MATARGYDARACQNRQPVLFHRHPGQCLPGVEDQKWKGKRKFSPEHTIDFVLTLFNSETLREV